MSHDYTGLYGDENGLLMMQLHMQAWYPMYGMGMDAMPVTGMGKMSEEDCGVAEAGKPSETALRRRRRQRAAQAASGLAKRPAEPSTEEDENKEKYEQLMGDMEAKGDRAMEAVRSLVGTVARRSCNPMGCRLVQKAIEVASNKLQAELVAELHGHVREAIESPHANYVVQKIVEGTNPTLSAFVAKELLGQAIKTAKGRFGCRVILRLLEHCGDHPNTVELVNELLEQVGDLSRNSFAHHVISGVLQWGNPEQKHRVLDSLRSDPDKAAKNRNASYVLEKALSECEFDAVKDMAEALTGGDKVVVDLANHQFGCYVLRAILKRPSPAREEAVKSLVKAHEQLIKTRQLDKHKYFGRVMQELRDEGLVVPGK